MTKNQYKNERKTSHGNGRDVITQNGKDISKKQKLPDIKEVEKFVLQSIFGQDKADVEDMIYNLIENANGNIEKAQNGIIVIDEIDKKAGNEEHDVAGTEVLKSLLKIIEGTIMQIPLLDVPFSEELINFDTKNIIIIFLGAFSGLDKLN